MPIIRSLKCLAVACTALGALPLAAQESPYSFDLKLHGGIFGGDIQKDHRANKMFGFGVEGAYSLGGKRAITAELGYDVITAKAKDVTPTGSTVWIDPAGAGVPGTGPINHLGGAPITIVNETSIDYRKESAQGFSLKAGYTDALPWGQGLTWKAGLSLDSYKVQSEFTGTLTPRVDGGSFDPNYYEGWAFNKMATKTGIGAYVGVGMVLMDSLRIEFNLRNFSCGHYDYKPFTYTGKAAVLEESTRRAFAFEIGLALKL